MGVRDIGCIQLERGMTQLFGGNFQKYTIDYSVNLEKYMVHVGKSKVEYLITKQ